MNSSDVDTIGCDLGDRESTTFILRADGQTEQGRFQMTQEALRAYFTRAPAHVVVEVGPHSRWVCALLEELGHRVTAANPRRLKLISASDSKSDRTDAELLARLGRADVSLLAPVEHRGMAVQADLAVAKARDALVDCRTRLVNSIRGTVKCFGVRLPTCAAEHFHKKARALIPEALVPALTPLFSTLEALDAAIREHDRSIAALAQKYPDVEVVSQPMGVGPLTALVFVLTLEDKARFKSSRDVGAFLGLRPRKDQSGGTDKQLPITKAGDAFLRRLLVNCATYMLGPRARDSDLRRWGLTLGSRGGKNGKRRARIAVARKLAVLMHRLWVTGEEYQPVGYARAA